MGITMTLEFEEIVTRKDLGPEQDGNCPVGLSMKPEQFSFTLSAIFQDFHGPTLKTLLEMERR